MWTLEKLLELAEQIGNVSGNVTGSGNVSANVIALLEKVSGEQKKVSGNVTGNVTRRKVVRPHWKKRVDQSEHRFVYGSREETLEMDMTETQREVFLMVDEWWKRFGFSPTVREIALWRKKGVSNTQKVIDRLVKIGALKRVDGMQRTLRPTYVNFRNLE